MTVTLADAQRRMQEIGPLRAYDEPPLPGTIFDGPHEGETVEQALKRREDHRFGLNGLTMRHIPSGRRFSLLFSKWNKEGRLELYPHQGGSPGYLPRMVPSWECVILEAWPHDPRTPCKMKPFTGGRIYFIRTSSAVKIGFTTNVGNRFLTLQTANAEPLVLLGSIPGSRSIEAELHDHFSYARLQGEWFTVSDLVMTQIEGILQDGWPIP